MLDFKSQERCLFLRFKVKIEFYYLHEISQLVFSHASSSVKKTKQTNI